MQSLVEKCLSECAHSPEARLESANYPRVEIAAPITVYSRRETDERYDGVVSREGDLRIVTARPTFSGSSKHSRLKAL